MMQNQRGHNKVIFFIGKLAADQVRIGKLSTIKHASVNLACDYLTHTVRIIRQSQRTHMRCQKLRHQPGACAKLKDALVSLRLNRIHNQLGSTARAFNFLRVVIPLGCLVVKVMAMINHSRSLARLSVELRCFSMLPTNPFKNCATDNSQPIVRKPKGADIFIIDSPYERYFHASSSCAGRGSARAYPGTCSSCTI